MRFTILNFIPNSLNFKEKKIIVLKWKDKKNLSLLSTVPNADVIAVTGRKKEAEIKPKNVVDYNGTMGGAYRVDQR